MDLRTREFIDEINRHLLATRLEVAEIGRSAMGLLWILVFSRGGTLHNERVFLPDGANPFGEEARKLILEAMAMAPSPQRPQDA